MAKLRSRRLWHLTLSAYGETNNVRLSRFVLTASSVRLSMTNPWLIYGTTNFLLPHGRYGECASHCNATIRILRLAGANVDGNPSSRLPDRGSPDEPLACASLTRDEACNWRTWNDLSQIDATDVHQKQPIYETDQITGRLHRLQTSTTGALSAQGLQSVEPM